MSGKALWKTVAVSAATWAASAAGAEATWSPPATVAHDSLASLRMPVLAGSPRNGSTIAWAEPPYDSVIARRVRRDGTLGPLRRFTGAADFAVVAVGRSGTTVVVWSDARRRILARRMTPRGRLGRVHRLGRWAATRGGVDLDVGLDALGDATIAWSARPYESHREPTSSRGIGVHARRLSVSGNLGPRIDVPLNGGGNIEPRVAVAPWGRATIAWNFVDGPGPSAIHAATINRRSRLGRVIDVSETAGWARWGDLAVDGDGNATIVWQQLAPSAPYSTAILSRRIGANGSLGVIRVLAAGSARDDTKHAPTVSLDRAGNAIVFWGTSTYVRELQQSVSTIESRRIDLTGRLNPITNVSAPVSDVASFQTTVDAAGRVTVSWVRRNPPLRAEGYVLQVRRIGRDGILGGIETFASGGCIAYCDSLSAPRLASDANGVVTAVWLEPQPSFRGAIKMSRFVPG